MQQEQINSQNNIESQDFYRIAKEWRNLKIGFTNYIQQIIAFQKTSPTDTSYKIMLYFNNGRYQIWNVESQDNCELLTREKRTISDNAKELRAISTNELMYLDTSDPKNNKLRILNIDTHQHTNFQAQVPTLRAMPENERSEEKIQNLVNNGIQYIYNQKHKLLILLEERSKYTTSQQSIVTCWKTNAYNSDDKGNAEFFWQKDYEEQDQRDQYLVNMNDQDATVVIYGNIFIDQNFKYRQHKCVNLVTEESFSLVESEQLNTTIVDAWPKSSNELIFWTNPNNSGIPVAITLNLETKEIQKQELNVFQNDNEDQDQMEEEDPDQETNQSWMINEVQNYDVKKNIAIIGRSHNDGDYLDIYNPNTNKITFTVQVNNDMGIIKRSFSPDNRYFVEFEEQHHGDNDDEQDMYVAVNINTIVGIRTSICYFLEKSGVMDIYCPTTNKSNLNDNTNQQQNQKPDRQYEQLLEEVIGALTTGIKQE